MEHFEDTVVNGIPLGYLEERIDDADFNKLKELNSDIVRAWGFVPNAKVKEWEKLKEGDLVLFYANKGFFHMAVVHSKTHNQTVAQSLWETDDQGRTWEYMFFIKEGKSIQLPYDPTILIKANLESYAPNHIVQGAQLLTGRNAEEMRKYLEEKEGTSFDENIVEPTTEEEVIFHKKIKDPITVAEAEEEIRRIAIDIADKPVKERVKVAKMLVRNPKFARLVKERVKYICEICGVKPFIQKNGLPYAEAHHKSELARTKIDNPNDMICVCPTCHKVIHYGTEAELKRRYDKTTNGV
jgi:hypothetical protein